MLKFLTNRSEPELEEEIEKKGIEERITSIEEDLRWLVESQQKQVLNMRDLARITGYSRQTLYRSRQYLLPLNHFKGVSEWTRAEIMAHLSRPIDEIKAEYEQYLVEHKDEIVERGRDKAKKKAKTGKRAKIKSAS